MLCYTDSMTPEFWAIITVGVILGGLILNGQRSLRHDLGKRIDDQGKRFDDLGKRIDRLDERVGSLTTEMAALKATVETFFRVRIDPPPPAPNPEQHDQAA